MSDMLSSPYGLSVRRNGSCLSTETDCGQTWSPWHACCPGGTKCPSGQDNVKCCPSDADCSRLLDNKHCANETANVYKANGYFCCANGTSAFQKENGFVGCADDISDLNQSMTLLAITYSATVKPTSTPTPSSTISTTAPTTTSQSATNTGRADTGDSSSSSNSGAIAGGVVGGVAGLAILVGLIWFVLRRRSQSKKSATGPTDPSPLMSSVPALNSPTSNAAGSTQPGSSVSGSRSPDASNSGYYNTAPETSRSPVELESQADSGLHELPSLQAHR